MRSAAPLLAALALGGCATAMADRPLADIDRALVSDDPLVATAALLSAAEAAPDSEARAPMLARLDALAVRAIDGETVDPLAKWRNEAGPAELPYRGRTLGPAYRRVTLKPGGAVNLDQIFYAGKRAEMVARTNGGQPVVLAIADPRAGSVCEARLAPEGRCKWLPIFTERFSIALKNQSTKPANVYLVFE